MSVADGTRPGSKPDQVYPGWDYILCQGPGWKKIRDREREVMRWEGEINTATTSVDRALAALRVAHVFLHGGHVDKGTLAKSGLRVGMEPEQVLAHIQSLLPKTIPAIIE